MIRRSLPVPGSAEHNLDEELKHIVGVSHREYRRAMAVTGPMPMAMFNRFVELIDRSGVPAQLEAWANAERKSKVGRRALLSFRAVLVVELMSAAWSQGAQYLEFANTLAHRLTPEQFAVLGIDWDEVDENAWYHRHWRAKSRLLRLVDPNYLTQKRRRLTLEEQVVAESRRDETREARLNWTIQAFTDASVAMLPPRHRDAYNGDVAIDSTVVPILGRAHSRATTLVRNGSALDDQEVVAARRTLRTGGQLTNVDFAAGTYDHSHRDDKTKDPPIPAFELDLVTMMDIGGYDKHPAFARLITGVGFHRPSEITEGPRLAMQQHSRNFTQRGLVAADRAFNNLQSENFQHPLRLDNWDMAFDYAKDDFGHQASVPNKPIIVIDGAFYVHYMPERLQFITSRFYNDKPDPDTGALYTWEDVVDAIEARKAYALKPHGSQSKGKNGYRRYTYPDPTTYIAYDPATRKRVRSIDNKVRGRVTIAPDPKVVKHLQRYGWGTQEWATAYGQRNQIESVNKSIKHPRFTDLAAAKKRPGRGHAYQGIATALMIVAYNIRVLVRTLVAEFTPAKPKARKPRQKYQAPASVRRRLGQPVALAPPA